MRLLLPLLILTLAACGSSQEGAAPSASPSSSAAGPGISIQEALDSELEGPLYVRGYLFTRGGKTRLCDGFAESYPPRCVEPSLEVLGLKLVEQRQLYKTEGSSSGGVSWSEQPVKLLGDVRDGTLAVSNDALP